ncbi:MULTISPECIES: SIMPL domain-containing protein [unclassified Idiomarina]|uniref:SIMPL domain-containing protein n=1 Tax=unclassified Idiomarina TaxID=2614829 RepID=UPI000C94A9B6|nr:SIMPL domain-containing protein [Idiomarina sp. UBA3162]MAD52928.1 hypothetical protein [Idiomarinaceae bacterium]MEC7643339.1 SIMPL domain-containing protein [Pseudomonadota bacterium]MEC9320468.1 SIMPL domain-containing protein [Pseudomonadota bacterium]
MKPFSPTRNFVIATALAFLVSMSFNATAQARNPDQIRVTGAASASAVPDQVSLQFSIEQRGDKLSAMKDRVDQSTQKLLRDLIKRDIPERNIRSYQLQVYPQYQNDDGQTKQDGFVVMREISITLPDIEQYDQIVDLALAQGVTRVSQVRFEVSNQKDLYQRALADAFAAARDKATQLAGVAEREVGSVLEITEQSYPRPVVFHMAEARMDAKSASMPGEQQIEARIEVVFSLK